MPRERNYFVYILMNRTGTLYTGVTNGLEFRLFQHKAGVGSKFTARYGIHRLVWYEMTTDVQAAIAREKQVKGWTRARKVALIKEMTPHFRDLSVEWTGQFEAPGSPPQEPAGLSMMKRDSSLLPRPAGGSAQNDMRRAQLNSRRS